MSQIEAPIHLLDPEEQQIALEQQWNAAQMIEAFTDRVLVPGNSGDCLVRAYHGSTETDLGDRIDPPLLCLEAHVGPPEFDTLQSQVNLIYPFSPDALHAAVAFLRGTFSNQNN